MTADMHLAHDLSLLGKESSPADRLDALVRVYEAETGTKEARPLSDAGRHRIASWLTESGARDALFGMVRSPMRFLSLSASPYTLASFVSQLWCPSCTPVQRGRFVTFPIDINPWSAQSQQALRKKELQEAVAEELRKRPTFDKPIAGALCVTVVARGSAGSRRKDVDNLIKGLLDSMNKVVYRDDSQIQCVTVRRVDSNAPRGGYIVRAVEVHPFEQLSLVDDGRATKDVWARPLDP